MAGPDSAIELVSGRLRLRLATETDDAAIRRLLRDNPMRGAVSITLEREPSYFRGNGIGGAEDETVVAFEGDQLVCVGRCSYRPTWINGKIQRAGYLGELRLDASREGRADIVRRGYGFFEQLQRGDDATLYFSSIAGDNYQARRLLEKARRGFPSYHFLADFTTLIISVPRHSFKRRLPLRNARKEDLPAILSVLNNQAHRHQLARAWTAETLQALELHGLPLESFHLFMEGDRFVGCGALWDQRAFRQTRIHRYSSTVQTTLPIVNFVNRLKKLPPIPRAGSVLKQAFVSPLGFAGERGELLADFIQALFHPASNGGIEYLVLGFASDDERLPKLRKQFHTRTYSSRIYSVNWAGDAPQEFSGAERRFLPDVSLL